jgi:hypothetical protein
MKIQKKNVLILLLAVLFTAVAILAGGLFYVYTHPKALKPLAERAISRYAGTPVTIQTLTYSLSPLRIRAAGIQFNPGHGQRGFHLHIRSLDAKLSLKGPFGNRCLTIEDLSVSGLSLSIAPMTTLPRILGKGEKFTFFSRIYGQLRSLILFRNVRIRSVRVEQARMAAQIGEQLLEAADLNAKLNMEGPLEIACSAKLKWADKKGTFSTPDLRITIPDFGALFDRETPCTVTLQSVKFLSPTATARVDAIKLRTMLLSQGVELLRLQSMTVDFTRFSIGQAWGNRSRPVDLQMKANANFRIEKKQLDATDFSLTAGNFLKLDGKIKTSLDPDIALSLDILKGEVSPQGLLPFLPANTSGKERLKSLSGPIRFAGTFQSRQREGKWTWGGDLKATAEKNQISYRSKDLQLKTRISGFLRAKGQFPDMTINLAIEGEETLVQGVGGAPKSWKADLTLSGKHPLYQVTHLQARVPMAFIQVGDQIFSINRVQVNARKGQVNAQNRRVELPEIFFSSSWVRNLTLALRAERGRLMVTADGQQTTVLKSALKLDLLPTGWEIGGRDRVQVKIQRAANGDISFFSSLSLQSLSFQNRDGSCMGEKIALTARMTGGVNPRTSGISVNTSLEVTSGELLYNRFYFDLARNSLASKVTGEYHRAKRTFKLSESHLALKNILQLSIRGVVHWRQKGPWARLAVKLPETPLKPAFRHFLQEPFKREKPFLSTLTVDGTTSVDLQLIGQAADLTVKGHFRWRNGNLASGRDGPAIKGIQTDLPIWYQRGGKPSQKDPPLKGHVSMQSLILPMLPKQPLKLSVETRPNQVTLGALPQIPILGGTARLGPIRCRNLFGTGPVVESSLTLNSVRVDRLLTRIWKAPPQGTLNGTLVPLRYKGGVLSSSGQITVRILNGQIVLSDLGASGLFTPAPVIKLSARLKDLSLEAVTQDTPFGKIEGILMGQANNVEIAYGQPQRFDLLLETVKKKGVTQRISVKAVDNIARIGGGHSPFMGLAGGFATLFKEFPYRKIGIHAQLENDVFKIKGTIKEGGTEYLVRRGTFSGVDIVNQNPDNRISFKDMVKRIKRISAKGDGPIVR